MNKPAEILKGQIVSLPDVPGVYQFFDSAGKLLYVGKAKNLKKRVSSYFNREHENARLNLLVKKIAEIKTIKVETELDALLLENNLIKNLKPKYNVNLRDDKTYPWVVIKNERFPRLFYTRKLIKDGSEYFGPYANVRVIKVLLDMVKQLYPLRNCSYDLKEENIQKKKYRECLEYQIGRCKAPCTGKQDEKSYEESINKIREILKGNLQQIIKELKEEMFNLSEKLEFEKASLIKEKIGLLETYQAKSTVVHPSITDVDVFHLVCDVRYAYVSYLKVKGGAIVQGQTLEIKRGLEESEEELLLFGILELRNRFSSGNKEIILPFEPSVVLPDCHYTVPKIGDKKKLLDLCFKNAMEYKREKDKQQAVLNPEKNTERIMQQMMKDLRLKEEPRRIEAFDNSNIQGAYAVSAMPVFINGKPAKKEYRHFNIKTVQGPDDFASMEEVIYRRYSRVLKERLELPQLVVIDGGKGQLQAALKSLEKLNLTGKVAVIGIAKKLEEIYFPGDSIPLYLDKRSETLKVIQHIRDEAHRFGITHHRNKRSKETIASELTEIKGISDISAQKLLKKFKSVANIRNCSFEELALVLGKSKAELIIKHFH